MDVQFIQCLQIIMGFTMIRQSRAPKGGTVGMNGEFYKGGRFLPSTNFPKRNETRTRGTGKMEIEPYVWRIFEGELAEGEKVLPLITASLAGAVGRYVWGYQNGTKKVIGFEFIPNTGEGWKRQCGKSDAQFIAEITEADRAWKAGYRWRIHNSETMAFIRYA